jgi:hypothetical protein
MTTDELGKEITELKISIGGYVARVEAQNTVTNTALINIDKHLEKLNGKVEEHEKTLNERALVVNDFQHHVEDRKETCPMIPEIRVLQDERLSTKSVKKMMFYMFSGGIALGGLIVGIIKLVSG